MSRYFKDKGAFLRNPTSGGAAELLASAMEASGKKEIVDSELIQMIFAIRDFLYVAQKERDAS